MAASLVRSRFIKFPPNFLYYSCYFTNRRHYSAQVQLQEEVKEVEYPPIKPRWPPGQVWGELSEKNAWKIYDETQNIMTMPTVEERIKHLTSNENKIALLRTRINPKNLQYFQDRTKTNLVDGLPDVYSSMEKDGVLDLDAVVTRLRPIIIDGIEMEHDKLERSRLFWAKSAKDMIATRLLLKQTLLPIRGYLSGQNAHMQRSRFDENVRVVAFWDKYGEKHKRIENDYNRNARRRRKKDEDDKPVMFNEPYLYRFQADEMVPIQIRVENPLPEFVPLNNELCLGDYPHCDYSPIVMGFRRVKEKQACVPGFNLGDPCEFGLLSILFSNDSALMYLKKCYGDLQYKEALIAYGLMTSFIWTVSQAHYQGFNTFLELTYPFTTQTIAADGQNFSFFAYQLNTLHLWKSDEANPRRNLCWASLDNKLYDKVENGKVKGFNDDVFKTLLKFVSLKPVDRGVDLRPYLPKGKPLPVDCKEYIPKTVEKIIVEEKIIYDESRSN
ncbi:hypothetical protein CHS0354_038820 [Potamilus streckersoni]|uniref:28S ribosomal protein S30, mitochondrial n=1 Tax=Potamilus streckersoni TaxID=2493646 RepID=A0AAE0WDH1_9BIVA|nr:hypothetical protein CHS0354_038820 [Potamilus streckersoni]